MKEGRIEGRVERRKEGRKEGRKERRKDIVYITIIGITLYYNLVNSPFRRANSRNMQKQKESI